MRIRTNTAFSILLHTWFTLYPTDCFFSFRPVPHLPPLRLSPPILALHHLALHEINWERLAHSSFGRTRGRRQHIHPFKSRQLKPDEGPQFLCFWLFFCGPGCCQANTAGGANSGTPRFLAKRIRLECGTHPPISLEVISLFFFFPFRVCSHHLLRSPQAENKTRPRTNGHTSSSVSGLHRKGVICFQTEQ